MHTVSRSTVIASCVAGLLASAAAMAAPQTSSNTSSSQSEGLAEVVVTGSRIKRAVTEGASPVVVLTNEDIAKEGFQTVADALQTLSQNTTSSFTGDLAVTGFTPNAQVVNLRNLGPGYTLTLVNGRRPAEYPQPYNFDRNVVNVRAIPSAAIERVEVLTGGASAIYGADAIAGVVNIITRKNYDGNQLSVTGGATDEGGGGNYNLSLTSGRTGDNWSAVVALQFSEQQPVYGVQRKQFADLRNGPIGATATPALSLIAIRGLTLSSTARANTNAYYPGAAACDDLGFTTATTATRGTYCGSFDQVGSRSISNYSRWYSAFSNVTYNLNENTDLFGDLTYYKSDAKASSGTEFWGTSVDPFNRDFFGEPSFFYFDPQLGNLIRLQRIFGPNEIGGLDAASTLFDEETYGVTVGARGSFGGGFDWEAAVNVSRYDYAQDRPRLLAKATHDYFLGNSIGYDPFFEYYEAYRLNLTNWSKPLTPEIYRSIATRIVNTAETGSSTVSFSVSGDLFTLPSGPVSFAAVAEAGNQEVDLRSDPRTDPNRPLDNQSIVNLVSSGRTVGERDRYALGTEFRIPVSETVTATAAARWDKYDDASSISDAITYQGGLEWRPSESLLVRGSYGTSFRAPDMQLIYAQGGAYFSTQFDYYACRTGTGPADGFGPRTIAQCLAQADPTVYTMQTRLVGNSGLKEEEGKSFTAGFVWDINDNFSVSSDYYRIQLESAASQLSEDYLLDNEASCRLGKNPDGTPFEQSITSSFCQRILSFVNRANAPGLPIDGTVRFVRTEYINTAVVDVSGVDTTLKLTVPTEKLGRFRFDVAYSVVLTDKYKQFDDDLLIDYRNLLVNSNQRSRVRATLGWANRDWSATLFATRFGSAASNARAPGVNAVGTPYGARLQPYMLYNLQAGKSFGDNLRASVTIVNLFNNQYREDPSATGYPFFTYWKGADPLGRRYNANISYKF